MPDKNERYDCNDSSNNSVSSEPTEIPESSECHAGGDVPAASEHPAATENPAVGEHPATNEQPATSEHPASCKNSGFSAYRALLWVALIVVWLLYLAPGFFMSATQRSASLPVQGFLQMTAIGKLIRVQDTQALSPQLLAQFEAKTMLSQAAKEYDNHPYVVICQALECLHRADSKNAARILSDHPCSDEKLEPIYTATLEVSLARQAGVPAQRWGLERAMILQEAVYSQLRDYYQVIAQRELAAPGLWSPSPCFVNADDVRLAHRDIAFLGAVAIIVAVNLAGTLSFCVWLLMGGKRLARNPLPLDMRCDPLRVCGAYVFVQWLMMLVVICSSSVFAFLHSRVVSLFTAYLCAYTVLIAVIAFLLPRLEPGETRSELSVAKRLRWGRPRWSDLLWGWLGFALTMVTSAIITQLLQHISGKTPYSENPFLDIVSHSQAGEWILLLVQLAVLGPIFEEILFRGLLFGGLRSCWRPWVAALVSSAVFGLTHIDPQGTFVLVGMGLCFAYVYHKSDSLWSAIIAHGLWNGFVALHVLYMS